MSEDEGGGGVLGQGSSLRQEAIQLGITLLEQPHKQN